MLNENGEFLILRFCRKGIAEYLLESISTVEKLVGLI